MSYQYLVEALKTWFRRIAAFLVLFKMQLIGIVGFPCINLSNTDLEYTISHYCDNYFVQKCYFCHVFSVFVDSVSPVLQGRWNVWHSHTVPERWGWTSWYVPMLRIAWTVLQTLECILNCKYSIVSVASVGLFYFNMPYFVFQLTWPCRYLQIVVWI